MLNHSTTQPGRGNLVSEYSSRRFKQRDNAFLARSRIIEMSEVEKRRCLRSAVTCFIIRIIAQNDIYALTRCDLAYTRLLIHHHDTVRWTFRWSSRCYMWPLWEAAAGCTVSLCCEAVCTRRHCFQRSKFYGLSRMYKSFFSELSSYRRAVYCHIFIQPIQIPGTLLFPCNSIRLHFDRFS